MAPSALLRSYGIDPGKPVELRDLRSLMHGFSPVDGEAIRPAGSDKTQGRGDRPDVQPAEDGLRVVGDLGSVSSCADRGRAPRGRQERACSGPSVRSRSSAARPTVWCASRRAERLLAVESVHTTSRLAKDQDTQGIPDPQLHSHVAVIAAERKDGQVAAVESKQLFRAARENGAWYRAELAENLKSLGLPIERRTGNGERYFEIKGVSTELAEHWSTRSQDVDRAAQTFRQRYGREPQAGELDSLTLEHPRQQVRRHPGRRERGVAGARRRAQPDRRSARRNSSTTGACTTSPRSISPRSCSPRSPGTASMVTKRELRAKAYELSAGVGRPAEADRLVDDLARSGELLQLEDGTWTTRQLREQEQATIEIAERRASETPHPSARTRLKQARREIGREIKGSLTQEQREALDDDHRAGRRERARRPRRHRQGRHDRRRRAGRGSWRATR